MNSFRRFGSSLVNPQFVPTAVRVALVVGTLLFAINHGRAALNGNMTRDRWLSGALSYFVPYVVNIHGQYSSRYR
jgi:hypothetical protein